jgi:excisionase family DNA binding protein
MTTKTDWATVSEAAAHIKAKHPRMVRDAIARGEIPAYTYGKSAIRVKLSDVDAWLEAHPWEEAS